MKTTRWVCYFIYLLFFSSIIFVKDVKDKVKLIAEESVWNFLVL